MTEELLVDRNAQSAAARQPAQPSQLAGAPVFICGYAKSGTTLLVSLLEGHPDIMVFPEETFFLRYVRLHPNASAAELGEWLLDSSARYLRRSAAEENPDGVDYSDFDHEAFERLYRQKATSLEGVALLEAVAEAYAQTSDQSGRRFWLEKSPGNEHYLSAAVDWRPDLRPIYIVRDPRDVYVSYSKKRNADGRGLPLGRFLAGWAGSLASWMSYRGEGNPGLLVRYEDLVSQPRLTLEKICAYLGVDYHPALETPTKNGQAWHGNSMHGQRFEKVSAAATGRWRQRLDDRSQRAMEWYLGRSMLWLGYETDSRGLSFREWLGLMKASPIGKMLGNSIRLHWPFVAEPFSIYSLENLARRLSFKRPIKRPQRAARS